MKHIATLLAVITLCTVPVSVSAQSTDTISLLEAQVQALLQRVTELQGKVGTPSGQTVGNVTATGAGVGAYGAAGGAVDSSACPNIGRSLKRGASGEDVRRLQQFLAQDVTVYPEGQVTGYYGALTEAAVRRWQVKYQVVSSGTAETTGYGVVGPRTAAAIALLCSTRGAGGGTGASPVGGFIQVTPISGTAPLKTRIVATVNTAGSCTGATYALDVGDGRPPEYIPVAAGNCNQVAQTFEYTYQYGGTYQIVLSAGAHRTTATVQVAGSPRPTTTTPPPVATSTYAIITVQPLGTSADGASINATFAVPPCKLYQISWGDSTPVSTVTASCTANDPLGVVFEASHTYTTAGTYTLGLKDGTGTVKSSVGVSVDL